MWTHEYTEDGLCIALLPKLGEVLDKLPNVKQMKTRELLIEISAAAKEDDLHQDMTAVIDELNEIFISDHWGVFRVSPKGVDVLLEMYREGLFELKRKTSQIEDPIELLKFSKSEPELLTESQRMRIKEKEMQTRIESAVKYPDRIPESDFTHMLLDEIFFHHKGRGSHDMMIGGIRVKKTVSSFVKFEGKIVNMRITFDWIGRDGKRNRLEKLKQYINRKQNGLV